jgi:hypothetical protein
VRVGEDDRSIVDDDEVVRTPRFRSRERRRVIRHVPSERHLLDPAPDHGFREPQLLEGDRGESAVVGDVERTVRAEPQAVGRPSDPGQDLRPAILVHVDDLVQQVDEGDAPIAEVGRTLREPESAGVDLHLTPPE